MRIDSNNNPTFANPGARALALLRVAEGADRDIINGRNPMDAEEERAAAIRSAIEVLDDAYGPTPLPGSEQ